jgi:1,4-dihydroxy-6-naphthoate synthase
MIRPLSLGFSPCPNDTFIFHALVHGLAPLPQVKLSVRLADVETLNSLALNGALDVAKVSCHALGHLRRDYVLLRSGAALGRGCGPLVVSKNFIAMADLAGRRIAIPGRFTTAALLLQLQGSSFGELVVMPFEKIMAAVAGGSVDAGVIIHESRFTYRQFGLRQLLDLGQWWEERTGQPIPLGGIVARRDLGDDLIRSFEQALRASVAYAFAHPRDSRPYSKAHAQELADEAIDQHIGLYVNDFSLELGHEGEAAVALLLQQAEDAGLIPPGMQPLFPT